jgi:hypothetical protein
MVTLATSALSAEVRQDALLTLEQITTGVTLIVPKLLQELSPLAQGADSSE